MRGFFLSESVRFFPIHFSRLVLFSCVLYHFFLQTHRASDSARVVWRRATHFAMYRVIADVVTVIVISDDIIEIRGG